MTSTVPGRPTCRGRARPNHPSPTRTESSGPGPGYPAAVAAGIQIIIPVKFAAASVTLTVAAGLTRPRRRSPFAGESLARPGPSAGNAAGGNLSSAPGAGRRAPASAAGTESGLRAVRRSESSDSCRRRRRRFRVTIRVTSQVCEFELQGALAHVPDSES